MSNQSSKKNILFLTARFPYPLIGGDRIKSFHLLRHLSKHHNVTLISCIHGEAPTPERLKPLIDLGITVHTVTVTSLKNGLRSIKTLWTDQPLEIAFYDDPAFHVIVRNELAKKQYDLLISFFMRTAEYVKDSKIPKLLIAEDCRVLYQSRSASSTSSILQKMIRSWEVMKLKSYEPSILRRFDCVTCVTHTDIEAMRRAMPHAQYALLTNGIDLEAMPASSEEQLRTRKGIVFVGLLHVLANAMMALNIAKNIFPKIRSRLPEVTLTIAGSEPGSAILDLEGNGIHVKADVEVIEDVYYQSAIFLHPHKGASGIQNKALQALAMGCALITTESGSQGIPIEHGKHAFIAETEDEMSEYAIQLMQDDAKRIAMSQEGRRLIEENFSWSSIFAQLDTIMHDIWSQYGKQS
ncbi:MAG: glycosyltransferase [Candidatus Kapaibacteriota bacterium]